MNFRSISEALMMIIHILAEGKRITASWSQFTGALQRQTFDLELMIYRA